MIMQYVFDLSTKHFSKWVSFNFAERKLDIIWYLGHENQNQVYLKLVQKIHVY